MATISKGHFVHFPSKHNPGKKRTSDWYDSVRMEPWYNSYTSIWNSLESRLMKVNDEISRKFINDVVQFVFDYQFTDEFIPIVTLFTGINLSDHDTLFSTISKEMQTRVNCRVVTFHQFQSIKLKYLIECVVSGFINQDNQDEIDSESLNDTKRIQYTLLDLHDWYKNLLKDVHLKSDSPKLIIIIQDIQSVPCKILNQFLSAVNVYKESIPLIIIFGVATSLNDLHSHFSYEVFTKFSHHLFQSQPSTVFLNTVLENVFLTPECPFQISGKIFAFLTELFLNYNFSVKEFIRGIKFCLMNHFFDSRINILCCSYEEIRKITKSLSKRQRIEISSLPSAMKYKRKEQLPDNEVFEIELIENLLKELHEHLSAFHTAVRCLHAFTKLLPGSPLGTHVREIYIEAMDSDISNTEAFKKCFVLFQYLSKDKILQNLDTIVNILEMSKNDKFCDVIQKMKNFNEILEESDMSIIVESPVKSPRKRSLAAPTSRSEFKKVLLGNVHQEKKLSQFEIKKNEFLTFLSEEFFKPFLKSPSSLPLSEIMVFSYLEIIKRCFDPAPRASLHRAMVNPCLYLKCECCNSTKTERLISFPDICTAYKLHLECGNRINLYDWLQSFNYVVNEDHQDNEKIEPEVHVRFSQAVKELQFLGFIASTKDNSDFVTRMTI